MHIGGRVPNAQLKILLQQRSVEVWQNRFNPLPTMLNLVQPGDGKSRRALAPFRMPNAGTYPTTKKKKKLPELGSSRVDR